jgi:hypothetical protein
MVEKFTPFSYKILFVLPNAKKNVNQGITFGWFKSEHKPGTIFVHLFIHG